MLAERKKAGVFHSFNRVFNIFNVKNSYTRWKTLPGSLQIVKLPPRQKRNRRPFSGRRLAASRYSAATHSISTSASLGSAPTWKAARAGNGAVKASA